MTETSSRRTAARGSDAVETMPVSYWPLAFILASLAALAATPLLANRYTSRFQHELQQIIEPARGQVTELHLAIALGAAALRDLLSTGDAEFQRRYDESLARERIAYAALEPLAQQIGGAVEARFGELREAESRWHARITELRSRHSRETIQQIMADEDHYENTLVAVARLDDALDRAAGARRNRIAQADRVVLLITLGLATLAAAAGMVAARLGRKLRLYAAAAEDGRRALQAALESNARMTRGITHDLKNPLGVILGHAELLNEGIRGQLNSEQRESVGRIRSAVQSMLGLIDTLLELARAESGLIAIEQKTVDLRALIEHVVESHRAAAQAAGLELTVEIAPDADCVETDPARAVQVLDNLLSNAVKYTPSGHIHVRAERRSAAAPRPGNWLAIHVQDTGPGIPPEKVEHIFDEFSRLDTATAEGTGLGLSIARRMARLLGGEVTVQSALGQGSTFTFWLPTQ